MAYLAYTCHILVGLVFAASAVAKVRSTAAYRDFRAWVESLPMCASWMAGAVVATEVAIVVLLIAPATALVGLLVAALTAAVFASGTIMLIRRRVQVTCRCFGQSDGHIGVPHVIRNGLMVAVAVAGAVATLGQPGTAITAPAMALCALAALVSTPFVIYMDDLVALFQRGLWSDAPDGPGGQR